MERGGHRGRGGRGGGGGRGRGGGGDGGGRGGGGREGEEQRWQQPGGQGRGRGFDPGANFQQFQRGGRAPNAPANAWGRGLPPQQQPPQQYILRPPQQQPPQQYIPRPPQQQPPQQHIPRPPQQQPPQQHIPRPPPTAAWGLPAAQTTSLPAAVADLKISGPRGAATQVAGPSGAATQVAGPSGAATQTSVPSGSTAQISGPSCSAALISATSGADGSLKPVRRPDSGGRNGCRQIRLIANHFKVVFDPTQQVYHYDVDMTLVEKSGGSRRGGGGKQKGLAGPSKTDFPARPEAVEIKNKLLQENRAAFGKAMPVYDGKKNLYSPIPLPEEVFHVKISKGEDSGVKEYKVALKLANKLDGRKLLEFLNSSKGEHVSVQQELLQALDLVVREYPSQSRIIIGRSLYSKVPDPQGYLNGGAVAARGFSMSLRPTAQGLALNLDFSVVAFHQQMPVLDYLWENCRIDCQVDKPLNPNERRNAERALRGLKITVNHRRTKQKFTVAKLTKQITRELTFEIAEEGKQKRTESLMDYFRQRYGANIEFKLLPCLDLSKQADRPNYVPMEFCTICEGQRFPKDSLTGFQTKNLLKMACPRAQDRLRIIKEIMNNNDGPRKGPYLPHFQMTVGAEMTEVTARVLEAPQVRLGDRGQVSQVTPRPDDRQWNLLKSHVFDGKQIDRWGIVYFAFRNPESYSASVNIFCRSMVNRFRNLGINMVPNPMISEPDTMDKFDNAQQLQRTLNSIHTRTRGQLQILICVMEDKHSGYKNLKLICETEIGLVTQCCLMDHVKKCGDSKYGSQYLANLALKINAKIGGSNAALVHGLSNQLPRFGNSHVVYFGADVNHPGKRDERSPSIAAVVMSINWPHLNKYVVKIRCQKNRQEYISELGDMSKELLDEYLKIHKKLPERIIFFRDGVSEGQFDIVLNQELVALKRAFKQFGERYNPAISFIIAQKRHHTRLFPLGDVTTKSGNVPPGTVLDTVIVHPREFDFYLCSHYGLLGTSKPTHYHVLWDENVFTSDELQALINNLCYTFARCTKPVSLAPPVYYADLAAYRGRMYVEGLSASSETSSSASSSSGSSTCLTIPKINVGVENFMFFL